MRDARQGRGRRGRRPRLPVNFNWRRAMFVLPNLFTLSSIFCGFYAIALVSGAPVPQQFYDASRAVFFGIFFDMADGRVARLTRTQSDFGIQLDSLADVITFGAAPALIAYHWGLSRLGFLGVLAAFVYVACGALRLARFNVLATRGAGGKKYFIGLPIPLAAGVVVALIMFHEAAFGTEVVHETNVLALVLVLAYLMVSNVRYRSFKDLRLSTKSLGAGFALAIVFGVMAARIQPAFALLAFFGAYVLLGLTEEVVQFARRRTQAHAGAAAHGSVSEVGVEPPPHEPDPGGRR